MALKSNPSSRSSDMGDSSHDWQKSGSFCSICHTKFTLSTRRHHCRKCGNCVCDSCSQQRLLLNFKSFRGLPQRVCDACCQAAALDTKNVEEVVQRSLKVSTSLMSTISDDSDVKGYYPNSLLSPTKMKWVSGRLSPTTKRQIGIRTRVLLDFVDDLHEEIHLDFMVAYHFEDPAVQPWDIPGPAFVEIADYEAKGILIPRMEIQQTRSWEMIGEQRVMMSPKTGIVYIWRHYRVVLKEILELERFPFDRQCVKLKLQSFNPAVEFQKWFAPKEDIPPRIRNIEMWDENENVIEYEQNDWTLDWASSTVEAVEDRYIYTASFGLSRVCRYYMTNFVLVLFTTVELSTFCVAIEPTDFGGRAGLNFTLLLTIVAFKFSMTSVIPKISYQTYLDYYNLMCISALTLVIVENFFVSGLFNHPAPEDATGAQQCSDRSIFAGGGLCHEFVKTFDLYFVVAFNVFWISIHIFILLAAEFGWFFENWETVKLNDDSHVTQRACSNVEKIG